MLPPLEALHFHGRQQLRAPIRHLVYHLQCGVGSQLASLHLAIAITKHPPVMNTFNCVASSAGSDHDGRVKSSVCVSSDTDSDPRECYINDMMWWNLMHYRGTYCNVIVACSTRRWVQDADHLCCEVSPYTMPLQSTTSFSLWLPSIVLLLVPVVTISITLPAQCIALHAGGSMMRITPLYNRLCHQAINVTASGLLHLESWRHLLSAC